MQGSGYLTRSGVSRSPSARPATESFSQSREGRSRHGVQQRGAAELIMSPQQDTQRVIAIQGTSTIPQIHNENQTAQSTPRQTPTPSRRHSYNALVEGLLKKTDQAGPSSDSTNSFTEGQRISRDFELTNDGAVYEEDPSRMETSVYPGNAKSKFRETAINPKRTNSPRVTNHVTKSEETMESLFQKMADSMAKAFEKMATDHNNKKRSPLKRKIPYTYAGEDYEDPKWFIKKITELLEEYGIDDELEKIQYVAEQLRGRAKVWYEANIRLIQNYEDMVKLFLEQHDSFAEICRIRRRVQGEQQPANEPAVAFITRKRRMCERVMPDASFHEIVTMLIDQLEPELGMRISARTYTDFNDFLRWAKYYEERLRVAVRTNSVARYRTPAVVENQRPPQPAPVRNVAPRNTSNVASTNNENRPSTRCRYCGAWHLHRDCPRNPENERGAERRPPYRTSAPNQNRRTETPTRRPTIPPERST